MNREDNLSQSVLSFQNSANAMVNLPCEAEVSPLSLAHECWEMEEAISAVLQSLSEIRQEQSRACLADMYEAEECPICLEPLFPSSSVMTACNHYFHLHCILRHLRVPNEDTGRVSCPLCRMDVDEAEILDGANGFGVGPDGYGHLLNETLDFNETIHYLLICQASAFHIVGALGFTCMSAEFEEPETEQDRVDVKKLAHAIQSLKQRQVMIITRATQHLVEKFESAKYIDQLPQAFGQ